MPGLYGRIPYIESLYVDLSTNINYRTPGAGRRWRPLFSNTFGSDAQERGGRSRLQHIQNININGFLGNYIYQ